MLSIDCKLDWQDFRGTKPCRRFVITRQTNWMIITHKLFFFFLSERVFVVPSESCTN